MRIPSSTLGKLGRRGARAMRVTLFLALGTVAACSSTPNDEFANLSAEKLYEEARKEMSDGGNTRAIKALERVEGRAAGTLLAQQAQLDLAYLYWKTAEKAQALATIERFIKLHPSSPAFDYALYLRGLIDFNDNLGLFGSLAGQDLAERDQQASRDAYQAFKQLIDQFPNSKYAGDARVRMDYIVNALAAHEVHVARYYFRREAFLAAANRAQRAIAEFPQTPAHEEALFILMASYERLGLEPLRADAERVLRTNFPTSRFLLPGARVQTRS
jgi:outer membrane protein assembly factor BamD